MFVQSFVRAQRELLALEHEEECGMLSDKLTALGAAECEREGLSILGLHLDSITTGLYGRSIISLYRNNKSLDSSFKSGDEVKLWTPKLSNTPNADASTLTGVVIKVTISHIEVAVGGDDEVDELLLTHNAPLRLDLLANDATHKKMMFALSELEDIGNGGPGSGSRKVKDKDRDTSSAGGAASPAAPLVSLLFGEAYARRISTTNDVIGGCGGGADLGVVETVKIQPFTPLNTSQITAVEYALGAPRIACIHGPPGTGKSTAVIELILQCVARGQRILVCAPSNVAVDSLVERLTPAALGVIAISAAKMREQEAMNEIEGGRDREKAVCGGKAREKQRIFEHGNSSTTASGNSFLDPVVSSNSSSGNGKSYSSYTSLPQPKIVRLGHPARLSESVWPHCLEALLTHSDEAAIVADVKEELSNLRAAAFGRGGGGRAMKSKDRGGKKGGKDSKDGGSKMGVDRAAEISSMTRSQIKTEAKALRKEIRQREEAAVATLLKSRDVVLATCVGAASKLLSRHDLTFDVVIIDEAAQALEAACWIPLLRGRKAVLAGDHKQLAPTIMSKVAQAQGLGMTLFERILEDLPENENCIDGSASVSASVSSCAGGSGVGLSQCGRLLDTQYRMNDLICSWASEATYDGKLKSHPSVADHTLAGLSQGKDYFDHGKKVKDMDEVKEAEEDEDDPSANVLLLLDTAGCDMYEDAVDSSSLTASAADGTSSTTAANSKGTVSHRSGSSSSSNMHEALLVQRHVRALVYGTYTAADAAFAADAKANATTAAAGADAVRLSPEQIGVITPYNSQLEVLRSLLQPEFPTLEIRTVDSFQGGEREAVIISMVRSNTHRTVGFLADSRRINVAVTRARRHLCVICDSHTVSKDAFIGSLVSHMSEKGSHRSAAEWIVGGTEAARGVGFWVPTTRSIKIEDADTSVSGKGKINGVKLSKQQQQQQQQQRKAPPCAEEMETRLGLALEALREFVLKYTHRQAHAVAGTGVEEGRVGGEGGELQFKMTEGEKETLVFVPTILSSAPDTVNSDTGICVSLLFPPGLGSYSRARIHEACEQINEAQRNTSGATGRVILTSMSEGKGRRRQVRVLLGTSTSTGTEAAGKSGSGMEMYEAFVENQRRKNELALAGRTKGKEKEKGSDKEKEKEKEKYSSQSESESDDNNEKEKDDTPALVLTSAPVPVLSSTAKSQLLKQQNKRDVTTAAVAKKEKREEEKRKQEETWDSLLATPSSVSTIMGTSMGTAHRLGGIVIPLKKPPAPVIPKTVTALDIALSAAANGNSNISSNVSESERDTALLEIALQQAALERNEIAQEQHERRYRIPLSTSGTAGTGTGARGAFPNPEKIDAARRVRERLIQEQDLRRAGHNKDQDKGGNKGKRKVTSSAGGSLGTDTSWGTASSGGKNKSSSSSTLNTVRAARTAIAIATKSTIEGEALEKEKEQRVSSVMEKARERLEMKKKALEAAEKRNKG